MRAAKEAWFQHKAVEAEMGMAWCDSPEEQQQRWRQRFTKIVNIQSEFSVEENWRELGRGRTWVAKSVK